MGIFKKKKEGGFRDVIRCDEQSYLIWKWHPNAYDLGQTKREYSVRTGSHLRVKDGEVAVFVYRQKNGTMQDFIVGPYDQKIKTGNFPVLTSIIGLFYEGDTPFQAEVFFINLAEIIQVKFGVPYFNLCDPRYPDFPIPVAVRGTITFKIHDYRHFIKCHKMDTFDLDTFQSQIRDSINRYVKDAVANAPAEHNIPAIQIESKTSMINDIVEIQIKERFFESFGVTVTGVDIAHIEIDKDSDEYIELRRVTKDLTTVAAEAQNQANIENYQETLRIQREEQQYAQHMQTRTANIGAYQIEKQTEVGVAGAEALGNMAANNVGDINLGNGAGFNPVSMMAGMTVGGVVGQNIAGIMNNAINPNQQTTTPPPLPNTNYYVAVNGNSTGPFDLQTLNQMAINGQFNGESLVWRQGMAQWTRASEVVELRQILLNVMPNIPNN